MKHFAIAVCAAGLLLAGCSSGSNTITPLPKQQQPQAGSWAIQAGASTQAEAVQGLEFYPASVTIDAGDSITWKFPAAEPHTVTFLGPRASPPPPNDPGNPAPAGGSSYDGSAYTSSGFVLGGKTYTLTFTKPGTYTYYCLIHGEMVGTVVVQPAGTAYPKSQAQIDASGSSMIQADMQSGSSAPALFPYTAGGAHLAAGISSGLGVPPLGMSSVVRFLDGPNINDSSVTIAAGTKITWTNLDSNLPHTVTVPAAGQQLPEMDPFSPPSGPSTYDGSTLVNSGPMFPGQSFSLTFSKPGTYTYMCLFHDGNEGMIGTVVVH